MELSEIIRRAEKELQTATRNLDMAKRRGALEQDVRNLEAKVEYRKKIIGILKLVYFYDANEKEALKGECKK